MIDELDERIIRRVQIDFPLTPEPYKVMAEEIGIAETELLLRLRRMKAAGVLRKMGAVLQHRIAGFHGNALCCWQVPPARLEAVAALLTACGFVSHVYLRVPHAKWPYNLYTVFHSYTRAECLALVQDLAQRIGVTDFRVLFSKKNWKRSQLLLLQEPK